MFGVHAKCVASTRRRSLVQMAPHRGKLQSGRKHTFVSFCNRWGVLYLNNRWITIALTLEEVHQSLECKILWPAFHFENVSFYFHTVLHGDSENFKFFRILHDWKTWDFHWVLVFIWHWQPRIQEKFTSLSWRGNKMKR